MTRDELISALAKLGTGSENVYIKINNKKYLLNNIDIDLFWKDYDKPYEIWFKPKQTKNHQIK